MMPISRYAEITIPVTRLATIAAVASSATTLNARISAPEICPALSRLA
jgi:hypothetical protein